MTEYSLGFHCHDLRDMQAAIVSNGLSRGEFYNLRADEVPALKRELAAGNLVGSVHAPLVKPEWYPDPPTWSFLCDFDKDNRNLTLRMIKEAAAHAGDIGAQYLVVHFPTPSSDGNGESEARLKSIAWSSCDQLAEVSVKRSMPIHIEGLGSSPLVGTSFLERILAQYPLRYCFDTGHMHLCSKANGFDLYAFAEGIAPYLGSIHLWNNRGHDDYLEFRHIPLHPSQNAQQGWADIPRLFEALRPSCPVILESPLSYPEAIGYHDYRDGVTWAKELLRTYSS